MFCFFFVNFIRLYTCIDTIVGILCEASNSPPIKGIGQVIHHPISDNTPDYQNMSSIISQSKGSNTSRNVDSDINGPSLSLIKLYRIFYATKSVLRYLYITFFLYYFLFSLIFFIILNIFFILIF